MQCPQHTGPTLQVLALLVSPPHTRVKILPQPVRVGQGQVREGPLPLYKVPGSPATGTQSWSRWTQC